MKYTKLDPKTMNGFLKIFFFAVNLGGILQSEEKFYSFFRENNGKIQFDRNKNKLVSIINLRFVILFWLANGGGRKMETFVERQRRKIYRLNFAKIVAIRSPPLFF